MSVFEVIMLLCFGLSWPLSIAKTLKAKRVEGKSPFFMIAICVGYASGIINKLLYNPDWVTALYILNLVMVATDLVLYFKYSRQNAAKAVD